MKQPKTNKNPKGSGRKPPLKNSKTLQFRSVPIILHKKIKEIVKELKEEHEQIIRLSNI